MRCLHVVYTAVSTVTMVWVVQARLKAFKNSAANGAVVDNKSMTQWLETSFRGLPSDRHRHMFLDAATVLLAQPLQDLRCAWAAMVQYDDDCEADAAACITDGCLAELIASSLVSLETQHYSRGFTVSR